MKAASEHTTVEVMSFEHITALVSSIPTEIYDQNTNRLGILETDEVDALVEYYSQVENVEGRLEFDRLEKTEYEKKLAKIQERVEEGIVTEEEKQKSENLVQRDFKNTMEEYRDTLDRKRKDAIQVLEGNHPS